MTHVVITGAARGLGASLVQAYAAAGADVLAATRSGSTCGLREHPSLDVSDEASIETFASSVDRPVDVLINNAGLDARARGLG